MIKTLVSLLFLFPLLTVTQQDIDDAQSNLDSQLKKIDDISVQMQSIADEKITIESDINEVESNISQTNVDISNLESDIEDANNTKDEQLDISSEVLVAYQQLTHQNIFLTNILSNDGTNIITKMENNQRLVDLIMDEVLKTIEIQNQLNIDKENLENLKGSLQTQQQSLEVSSSELETKNDELYQLQNDTYAYADEIKSQIASLQAQLEFQNTNAYIPNEDKETLMSGAGINESDYPYVDYIISHESSWNYTATNPISGAYGLCQALPGSKMASSGSDWQTNPQTQMNWCNSYALSRYGSWSGAYNFWLANNWW